jgi:hypothetical protein
VFATDQPGPPIALANFCEPRLVISKSAVKKPAADGTLRFFAGRALFTQLPELMALRQLRTEHLARGLALVTQVLERRGAAGEEHWLREGVPERSWGRLKALVQTAQPDFDFGPMGEAARHTVNRAGLVVCGSIAPVVDCLRTKKARPSEMTELIRFAASDTYFQLRHRVLPQR